MEFSIAGNLRGSGTMLSCSEPQLHSRKRRDTIWFLSISKAPISYSHVGQCFGVLLGPERNALHCSCHISWSLSILRLNTGLCQLGARKYMKSQYSLDRQQDQETYIYILVGFAQTAAADGQFHINMFSQIYVSKNDPKPCGFIFPKFQLHLSRGDPIKKIVMLKLRHNQHQVC